MYNDLRGNLKTFSRYTRVYRQTPNEVAELLSKMSLKSKVKNKDMLMVEIPPTRHDVIHACDIYEDIAIAYGYNEIKKTIPRISTIAAEVNIFTTKYDFIY